MDGIITIKDSRANVMAMQQCQRAQIVERKKSDAEGVIDTIADGVETVVDVAGSVLKLVTIFVPGKLDDWVATIAQPAVKGVIEAGRNLLKGIFVNKDKEEICASIEDLAGNVSNISIKDTNLAKTIARRKLEEKPDLEVQTERRATRT